MRKELEKVSYLVSRLLERRGHGSRICIKEAAELASVSTRALWRWRMPTTEAGTASPMRWSVAGG